MFKTLKKVSTDEGVEQSGHERILPPPKAEKPLECYVSLKSHPLWVTLYKMIVLSMLAAKLRF